MRKFIISAVFTLLVTGAYAQIGEYRNNMSIGVNGGYVLSNVGFNPKVNQTYHGGFTGGVSFRYVCENILLQFVHCRQKSISLRLVGKKTYSI